MCMTSSDYNDRDGSKQQAGTVNNKQMTEMVVNNKQGL